MRYEKSATRISQFEPMVVPGLLQTPDYAEAVLSLYADPGDAPETVARRVQARIARQVILNGDDAPAMVFIVDESAIRRRIGAESGQGPEVLRRQLAHLKQLSARTRVSLRLLPLAAGAQPGLRGPFVIMEFAEPALGDLLYLEDAKGDYFGGAHSADLSSYRRWFEELETMAASEAESAVMLDAALAELGEGGATATAA
nr:DUF5753 domain-containing protein [Actinoplanes lichenis]